MADSAHIANLIAALEDLDTRWGVERTKRADELLTGLAHDVLIAEGDLGVWQNTRPGNGTRAEVAAALGKSVNYVQLRTSRHTSRMKRRRRSTTRL
jgi:hypothetical protein